MKADAVEPEPPDIARRWRLDVIEQRRAQAAGFTWSVPGLAIAGQAFLLAIVLSPDVTSLARVLGASAGVMAAAAAAHLYGKQIYLFDLYEAVIERERRRLGLPGVQTDAFAAMDFPENTRFVQRDWGSGRRWWHRLIVRRGSATVWLGTLAFFVFLDALLLVYSVAELSGLVDPDWLGSAPMNELPLPAVTQP